MKYQHNFRLDYRTECNLNSLKVKNRTQNSTEIIERSIELVTWIQEIIGKEWYLWKIEDRAELIEIIKEGYKKKNGRR